MLFTATVAQADECGQQPDNMPSLPHGSAATSETIRIARDEVVAYSSDVDKWLACMDQRIAKLGPYMTKEQRQRWSEDSADVHNQRRELQVRLNEAIRSYRDGQQSD